MNQRKIVANFMWRLMERIGAQMVGLVVSIILARLLDPSVYGIVALVNVFLVVLQVFVDSGLGTALIQKKDADQLDFSSVFYFNIFMCLIIYGLLFAAAPLISRFYNNPELVPIVRVVSITILISGVKGIQQAYVSRTMQFRKFFFATLGGTIVSAFIGILLAYKDFGVWALVSQNLTNALIDTFILWITVKWRPTLEFSFVRLRGLLSYGWKILFSSLISTIYTNLRQLLIGKFYTEQDLAFYNKGNEFPNKIVPNIETAITSVLLPTVASRQDDLKSVKQITRRAVSMMAFVIWPMMIGMAACGDTLISFLITDKWLPSVPYLRLFCIEAAFWPISAVFNNASKAIGRSDINLKVQSVIRTIGICILVFSIKWGPFAIAITAFIVTLLEFLVVSEVNRKLIGYRIREQFCDITPSVILSICMGILVLFIEKIPLPIPMLLFLQVVVGVIFYIGAAFLLRLGPMEIIWNYISKKKRGQND